LQLSEPRAQVGVFLFRFEAVDARLQGGVFLFDVFGAARVRRLCEGAIGAGNCQCRKCGKRYAVDR
jgi:hypothetical protein